MLEKINLHTEMTKEEYRLKMQELGPRLGKVQRLMRKQGRPVIILFEGWIGSRRNKLVSELMQYVDSRGFNVDSTARVRPAYRKKPFFTFFWHNLPGKGAIRLYLHSWYYLKNLTDEVTLEEYDVKPVDYETINRFEKELAADGYIILKIFLHLSEAKQKENLKKTAKYLGKNWLSHVLNDSLAYKRYFRLYEEMLQSTDTAEAPWHIIAADDLRAAEAETFTLLCDTLEQASVLSAAPAQEPRPVVNYDALSGIEVWQSMTQEEYKKEFKACKQELQRLQIEMYERGISTIIGFEGWDAAGKGGAIRRLTSGLEPLSYEVHPVAAPNAVEKGFHYLWRFWKYIPDEPGFVSIFDRTWYGRVMVERVEGFARPEEWQRAYAEINDMEAQWTRQNYCVLKFWLQIDKDEQLARFTERQNSPDKQWKITDEDWRNREKWSAYEEAVNEMLARTNTPHAPWIIVEGNNKYFARIKVLKAVIAHWQQKLAAVVEKKNGREKFFH